jgi:hypothetical protein
MQSPVGICRHGQDVINNYRRHEKKPSRLSVVVPKFWPLQADRADNRLSDTFERSIEARDILPIPG